VVAAEVMPTAPDFGHLESMLDAAQRELHAAGVTETPGVLLADVGYWHQQQMERIVDHGIAVLIPSDASKRRGARPGWDGGLYRRVSATERTGLYKQRQPMTVRTFNFRAPGASAQRTEELNGVANVGQHEHAVVESLSQPHNVDPALTLRPG
jgi:hypothetical protein